MKQTTRTTTGSAHSPTDADLGAACGAKNPEQRLEIRVLGERKTASDCVRRLLIRVNSARVHHVNIYKHAGSNAVTCNFF